MAPVTPPLSPRKARSSISKKYADFVLPTGIRRPRNLPNPSLAIPVAQRSLRTSPLAAPPICAASDSGSDDASLSAPPSPATSSSSSSSSAPSVGTTGVSGEVAMLVAVELILFASEVMEVKVKLEPEAERAMAEAVDLILVAAASMV